MTKKLIFSIIWLAVVVLIIMYFSWNLQIHPDEDIQKAKVLFVNFLSGRQEIQKLSNYQVRYGKYLNETGEKIIRADYFCRYIKEGWTVSDWGNCYFQVKVNLNTEEIFNFMVNGDA